MIFGVRIDEVRKEELEIIRRVNTDQEALKHMLMDIEFSKEKLLS